MDPILVSVVLFFAAHIGTALWWGGKVHARVASIDMDIKQLVKAQAGLADKLQLLADKIADTSSMWVRHDERLETLRRDFERLRGEVRRTKGSIPPRTH